MFDHRAFVALVGRQLSRALWMNRQSLNLRFKLVLCHVDPLAYLSLLRHLATLPWSGSANRQVA